MHRPVSKLNPIVFAMSTTNTDSIQHIHFVLCFWRRLHLPISFVLFFPESTNCSWIKILHLNFRYSKIEPIIFPCKMFMIAVHGRCFVFSHMFSSYSVHWNLKTFPTYQNQHLGFVGENYCLIWHIHPWSQSIKFNWQCI